MQVQVTEKNLNMGVSKGADGMVGVVLHPKTAVFVNSERRIIITILDANAQVRQLAAKEIVLEEVGDGQE